MADELNQGIQPQAPLDQNAQEKQLLLQKIYIKDFSFESPKAPEIFTTNTQAQTQLNIRSGNRALENDHVEVSLTLTVESKNGEDTLFLVEIAQAGVFLMRGYTPEERSVLLGSYCPSTLYPFAREAIADMATKGGFPQLLLQPINFDALYAQAMQDRANQAQGPGQPQGTPQAPVAPQGDGGTH